MVTELLPQVDVWWVGGRTGTTGPVHLGQDHGEESNQPESYAQSPAKEKFVTIILKNFRVLDFECGVLQLMR